MQLETVPIPAPIDGLNLRLAPDAISATEAVQLDNYLVYDWGIRETGSLTTLANPETSVAVGQSVFFKEADNDAFQLYFVNNKAYRASLSGWGSPTNLTGALTITNDGWRPCFFKGRIFLANGVNVGLIYNIAAATLAADTWTGTTSDNITQWWTYKERLYGIKKNSSIFCYTDDPDVVSGALVEYDTGRFLESFGKLLFGTSWSVNQGNYNEQLNVVVSTDGEVLIYSGDSPEAANWQLISRVQIPPPLGSQSFIRIGQDILIVTSRGVVSLGAVVSGKGDVEQYFNVSIKLGDTFGSVDVKPIRDRVKPFIYFPSRSANYIYVLNYERGAWSRIVTGLSGTITALSIIDDVVAGSYPTPPVGTPDSAASYLMIFTSTGAIRYVVHETGGSVSHTWKTGFMPIDPKKNKQCHKLRVRGRLYGGSNFISTASVGFDSAALTPTSDTKSQAASSGVYIYQELLGSGVGKRPYVVFSKTDAGEINDIFGFDLFFTTVGGVE